MSITPKRLRELKNALAQGNVLPAMNFLENESTTQDLEIFREQKLLFKVQNPAEQMKLATAYRSTAGRLYKDQAEIDKTEKLSEFSTIASSTFQKLSVISKQFCFIFQHISSIDLIQLTEEVLHEYFEHISNLHWSKLKRTPELEALPASELSDMSEYVLHEMSGDLNDIGFAAARALNEAIRYTNPSKRKSKAKELRSVMGKQLFSTAKESLRALIQIAGNWSSLMYAVDLLSYGECFIKDIRHTDPLEVEMSFSDIALVHARRVGIRRMISASFRGREKRRWMGEMLEGFTISIVTAAINYYESNYRTSSFSKKDLLSFQSVIIRWLDRLDAEDELLLAVAKDDSRVLVHYLAAIALSCFSLTGDFVRRHISRNGPKRITCQEIPIDKLVNIILQTNVANRSLVRQIVESFVLELPTTNYIDIRERPFIKLPGEQVIALGSLMNYNWPDTVRPVLVRGGPLAKSYGKIWEDFMAKSLEDFGWFIIGRGIKIRNNKRIITDIDILALKQGLLLIIQVKAIVSSGRDIYEQWKARNTIIEGAEQCCIAEAEIKQNPSLLNSLLASKRITERIERIQPLVLTNTFLFTGWNYRGVPVVGSNYLMSLLRGAEVKYTNLDQSVVMTERFSQGAEVSIEEFVEFIHRPWDWRITKETDDIDYKHAEFEGIKLFFPILRRDA